ncbi:srg-61 [Pristionchus pacificus]|uniref:Serpentine receptor class gamma n=1 Tax=Pristionchus pacificus TaxID=54126 RepID=A0A2A6BJM4_PRIPA|nr:srg-61 [Pristionchus pacificus]|eukprot:PDM66038.1 srg-61 [Pristionchus pacificus]
MMIRTVIQLSYGIPGIISYFLVFYVMFRIRGILSRSFVVIYVLMAVSNMITWVNAWIYLKLTSEPFFFFYYEWLEKQPFLINLHLFLTFHLYYVQNIDLLLLTLDRFAAVLSMLNDTKLWKKSYPFIALILHAIFAAAQLATSLPLDSKLFLNSQTGGYEFVEDDLGKSVIYKKATQWVYSNLQKKPLAAIVQIGFGIFIFLSCSILNIASLRYMRHVKSTKFSSIEKSFFVISFCIFLTQFMNLIMVCLVGIFQFTSHPFDDYMRTVIELVYYSSDLFSIGPALYTLLLPGPIRRFLIQKSTQTLRVSVESDGRASTT